MSGKCSRCGTEESMFWYPYAFGVAPSPSVTDRYVDRGQYFTLCDDCQHAFIDFMEMRIRYEPTRTLSYDEEMEAEQ